MIRQMFVNSLYRKHRNKILLMLDLGTVCISYLIAFWVKLDFNAVLTKKAYQELAWFMLLVLITYTVCFVLFNIYKSLWKYISVVEVIRLSLADALAVFILMQFMLLTGGNLFYISVSLIAGCFALVMMLETRMIYRLYRRYVSHKGDDSETAVIIGAGGAGNILLKEINQNDKLKYRVIGFVDDYKTHYSIEGLNILGTCDDLPSIKDKYHVKVALIAMRNVTKKQLRNVVDKCQKANLSIKMISDSIFSDSLNKRNVVANIKIEDLLGRGEVKLQQDEISSYITGKRILVTGAAGSIGSELCRQLVKYGPEQLVMLDMNENELYLLEQEFNILKQKGKIQKEITLISVITSIRDQEGLNQVFDLYKPDVVYHAAAHKHVPLMETRPVEAIKNNVFGTLNVVQESIAHKVSRFIMISTDKAVNPTSVMGATKRITEMILQANGNNGITKMAAVRFGNVLGSHGSVVPIFSKQIEEGGPLTITHRAIVRYFMTIPEAVQLVLQAGYYADKGEIFVLDMGEPVRILDLAENMIKLCGLKPYEDIDIVEIGLRPGEKMFEEIRLDKEIYTKTDNDLIYRNGVMSISAVELHEKLQVLEQLVEEETDAKVIRETVLRLASESEEGNAICTKEYVKG